MMLTPHPLLVPWSWKGRAIPLLPLWAIWPVQSLIAYKGALYLSSSSSPQGLEHCSQYAYCATVNPPVCLYVPTVAALCLLVFLDARDPSSERWNLWAGMLSENFAQMPTSTLNLGIFYVPQIYDMGPTALLPLRRKARWIRFEPFRSWCTWAFRWALCLMPSHGNPVCLLSFQKGPSDSFWVPSTELVDKQLPWNQLTNKSCCVQVTKSQRSLPSLYINLFPNSFCETI
jgi:hypothetical protein